MAPFKGEVPVFARLWPIRVRVRASFMTGTVRSAILATAGLLVTSQLSLSNQFLALQSVLTNHAKTIRLNLVPMI